MCGRYTLHTPRELLARRFRIDLSEVEVAPRYNVAPSEDVLVVAIGRSGERAAQRMHWGFIPFWASDARMKYSMINAKLETAPSSRAFGDSFRKRRCLILADGFYEWQDAAAARARGIAVPRGVRRAPHWIHLRDDRPFALAGLYSVWRPKEGSPVLSCTILTTAPNALLAPLHDRMPVVLQERSEEAWLDRSLQDPQAVLAVLEPEPAEHFAVHPVSTAVNSAEHDRPELIEAIPAGDPSKAGG